jgi:hypothetical protein
MLEFQELVMKLTSLLLLLLVLLPANDKIFSQQKWNQDPRMTAIYPTGHYVTLPVPKDNYVNPNKSVKVVQTPVGILQVNPNFRPHPTTTTTQSEVVICRNPLNQSIFFGSANTEWPPGGFTMFNEGVYVSTNGGVNWYGWDTVHSPDIMGHGGDPGPTIDKNGTWILSHLGYPDAGMYANYSTDMGVTWSATYTIAGGQQDKNFSGTDDAPGSPYYGRSYTAWSLFSGGIPSIAISYTTNGGVSWSSYSQVNNSPSGHFSQGVDIRCGPNGEVYLTWAAPVLIDSYTEDFDGFAKSTNGGISWSVTENAFDANGIRGTLHNKADIRVNSFPRIDVDRSGGPRKGWIYIVGCDKDLTPSGSDPDIILHRSINGGATWSAGIRVNQDALNNGATQYFPAIRVDEYGGINIVYYDDRNVGGNQVQVYMSRSVDGGNTWSDVQVSDHSFTPEQIQGLSNGYQGDYIGITSGNNKVWPIWMDNSSGVYQAWMTSVDIGPSIVFSPFHNTENVNGPYTFNCIINPAGADINPSLTKLLWSRNNPVITDSILMSNTGGNNWSASIQGNGLPTLYRYYIKTGDMLNKYATSPLGAPTVLYSFLAMSDTSKPVITHTPLNSMPKNFWPATVSASVTDYIDIDSVWVEWYKNINSNGWKEFKLRNSGGSIFSAEFNSDTSQVACNDSIFYRIIARDNSFNYNIDSTSLYQFKLLSIATACMGLGSDSVSWPFNSLWSGSRTDMLYTSNEITGEGGASGNITKVAFNIISPLSQALNGFTIKMRNTPASTLNGFVQAGWTMVYNGTCNITGTGMQYIDLQTPFEYDASQNLLVEICLSNSSDAPAQRVLVSATNFPGMTWTQYQNLQDGCGFIGGSGQSERPNLCMHINVISGTNNNRKNVPISFSLAQNYPNPFNPSTTIKFTIPTTSLVKLVIYDLLGREVKTLLDEQKKPGNYEAAFDGSGLASGIYFYKLESGSYVDAKKMVLVK